MTGLLVVCKWQPHVSYNRHLVSLLTEYLLCAQQGIGTYWYAHPFSCEGGTTYICRAGLGRRVSKVAPVAEMGIVCFFLFSLFMCCFCVN
jgi:hypothetical protein